jgi:hypothetical protein
MAEEIREKLQKKMKVTPLIEMLGSLLCDSTFKLGRLIFSLEGIGDSRSRELLSKESFAFLAVFTGTLGVLGLSIIFSFTNGATLEITHGAEDVFFINAGRLRDKTLDFTSTFCSFCDSLLSDFTKLKFLLSLRGPVGFASERESSLVDETLVLQIFFLFTGQVVFSSAGFAVGSSACGTGDVSFACVSSFFFSFSRMISENVFTVQSGF